MIAEKLSDLLCRNVHFAQKRRFFAIFFFQSRSKRVLFCRSDGCIKPR